MSELRAWADGWCDFLSRRELPGCWWRLNSLASRTELHSWQLCCPNVIHLLATSANFGHTVGKPVAYGYLPVHLASEQGFEIEVYGEAIPATRHDGALHDPSNARLKA